MELVNHNVQSAIFKLNKAYQLNSSAAALTLGKCVIPRLCSVAIPLPMY